MRTGKNTADRATEKYSGTVCPGEIGFPGTTCVCPRCGAVHPRTPGVPCVDSTCPTCGTPMCRKY